MFPRDTTSMRATFGLLVAASVAMVPQARAQMEVDSCQELRFPGEYVLTRDLRSPAGNCIVINRSQVTLDGQGHHIVGGVRQRGVGITLGRGADIQDIEIRNVVIAWFGVGIVVGNHARDGVISDVRLVLNDDGLNLDGNQFTLANSHIALNNDFGARTRGNFNVIEGNTFLNNQIGLYVAFPDSNSVIRDNRFVDHTRAAPAQGGFTGRPGMGLLVRSGPTRIRDNLIENNTRGIHIREVSPPDQVVRVDSNSVRGNVIGVDITAVSKDVLVTGNTIEDNQDGIGIRDGSDRISAWGNTIRDNRHHGVFVGDDLPFGRIPDRPDEEVNLGFNVFSGNRHTGVLNNADGGLVVDARNAYWGSPDGPSGMEEDPVTGTPADGEGDEVNDARFDPWLRSADSVFLLGFLFSSERWADLLGAGFGGEG